jgi:F-type H+-transporting ATPase subunit gamma
MANARDLSRKIYSLRNMQKVMRAMNMIASTKFRKISYLQESISFFNDNIETLEKDIMLAFHGGGYLEIDGYDDVKNIEIVMFTADRGLCGAHNSTIQKATGLLVDTKNKNNIESEMTCIGRKAAVFSRRNDYKIYHQTEINEKVLSYSGLRLIADSLLERFYSGAIQEIYLVFNEFFSTLSQSTKVVRVMPFPVPEYIITDVESVFTEPQEAIFLRQSARAIFNYRMKTALLNSYLSEHASRMTAMDNATNNSEDLINHYNKLRNKARQTTITNELIEIVAGKEAMK